MLSAIGARLSAYISLTKPRLVLLVLVTVAVGFVLGSRAFGSHASILALAATLMGTGLVAGGAGAINQWLERDHDARMRRTVNRALPSGRMAPSEAAVFGAVLTLSGTGVLVLGANLLAAGIALATFILYAFVYTPLKPLTTLNTVVGAVPGALPPLIGWCSATGRMGVEAWTLFLIVFLWQFPHFLAIAWIYREDYERGGFRMLPSGDVRGTKTGFQAVSYALALVPTSLMPATVGLAGPIYFGGALILGLLYLLQAARFCRDATDSRARRLLRMSFLYLPAVLLLLLLNPVSY